MKLAAETKSPFYEYLLCIGDSQLIVGQRLSEWCGHAPILEEDLALANIALDCLGQAAILLSYAAELEGQGRCADDLAFIRDEAHFKSFLMVELPRGDFGFTITRQFLYGTYTLLLFEALSKKSADPKLKGIAAKALKEVTYHVRHCRMWLCRLGDGTSASHERVQRALNDLWKYTGEFFEKDGLEAQLAQQNIVVPAPIQRRHWQKIKKSKD